MHGIYAYSMNIITFIVTEQKHRLELWNEEFLIKNSDWLNAECKKKTLSARNMELELNFIPFKYLEYSSGISIYALKTKLEIPIQK